MGGADWVISDTIAEEEGGFYFDSPDRMLSTWRGFHWTTFPCRLGQTPGWTYSYVNAAPNLLLSVFAASVASEETVINFEKARLRRKPHPLLQGKGEDIFSLTCLEQSRAEDVLVYYQIYQQVGSNKGEETLPVLLQSVENNEGLHHHSIWWWWNWNHHESCWTWPQLSLSFL